MKTVSAFLAFFFACAVLYAAEPEEPPQTVTVPPCDQKIDGSPLTFYRPIYILFGNMDDQVKGQISFKYNPFFGTIDNLGVYLAYTQLMNWLLYDTSSPFRDINFNPEVFWRLESQKNIFGNINLWPLDYFQLGIFEHKSNGKNGDKSTSWNRSYAQFQVSAGNTLKFGLNLKYFVMYLKTMEDQNRNIQQYIGSWEAMVFFKYMKSGDKVEWGEVYVRFGAGGGPNGFNFAKGWQEYGIIFPTLLSRVRPYIQLFHGYGQYLMDYNVKRTGAAILIGVILE
jgi:phospholipase A1/A2